MSNLLGQRTSKQNHTSLKEKAALLSKTVSQNEAKAFSILKLNLLYSQKRTIPEQNYIVLQ